MIAQTSLSAFYALDNTALKKMKTIIYRTLLFHKDNVTHRELARSLSGRVSAENVRKRTNELVKEGVVFCSGKHECSVTGRMAKTWSVYA